MMRCQRTKNYQSSLLSECQPQSVQRSLFHTTMSDPVNGSSEYDSYLTLVPRGCHLTVRGIILEQLASYYVDVQLVGENIKDEAGYMSHIASLIARQEEQGSKKKVSNVKDAFCLPVGSVEEKDKEHASLGYLRKTQPVWNKPGTLLGSAWLKIDTDAPVNVMANDLRVVGPIIALVKTWEGINLPPSQSADEVAASIQNLVNSGDYPLEPALRLWQKHAEKCWNISEDESNAVKDKIDGRHVMKYRLSCVRSDSEKYKYSRQQMLKELADIVVPPQIKRETWKVDLAHYDLEVVLLMHPHALAVGLALRPYQHLGAKSFAAGVIPPDTSKPYFPGQVMSGLIRLRPTTAQILLHLAELQRGDIVCDPAAGIGTIPIEAIFGRNGTVGIGGDIVLTPEGLGSVASNYSKEARVCRKQQSSTGGVADLMAWDATNLPFRDASVDAVVTDLPFGQQCMSSAKLNGIMPLMISEMARILIPETGRMVLLCGHFYHIVNALRQLNSSNKGDPSSSACRHDIVELPCDSVFPINIGGLIAWVVIVKRGTGTVKPFKNHKERVRKLAHKRERTDLLRMNEKTGKKRGIQSTI